MVRTARPSDLYRLPDAERDAQGVAGPPPPPRRRFPAWLGVALVLAGVLVVSGLIGTAAPPTTGNAPLVDIVSEDQAIAALTLYGAQADTIAELRERRDIYAIPGPRDAAGVALRGANASQRALDKARNMANPTPAVAAYIQHTDHATVTGYFADLAELADTIALLSLTHDTIYSGQGSIPLGGAYDQISSLVSSGSTNPAISAWGTALLEQMEDRPAKGSADAARHAAGRVWARTIATLQPAAGAELQAYLQQLPHVTIEGLRGHPVAGPALAMLEDRRRQAP